MDTELMIRGYLFHKGRLKVSVSKIYGPGASGDMQPLSPSHLVEISCIMPAGNVTFIFFEKKFNTFEKKNFLSYLLQIYKKGSGWR